MINITADMIDSLMCDETLHSIVKGKPTGFQMLFYVTFAQYQKTLEAQADTAATPEPEPESETDFEPGLCPVAEHVAELTEQLNDALGRLAYLESVAEAQHTVTDVLVTIANNHTSALDSVHNVVGQVLDTVQKLTKATK